MRSPDAINCRNKKIMCEIQEILGKLLKMKMTNKDGKTHLIRLDEWTLQYRDNSENEVLFQTTTIVSQFK